MTEKQNRFWNLEIFLVSVTVRIVLCQLLRGRLATRVLYQMHYIFIKYFCFYSKIFYFSEDPVLAKILFFSKNILLSKFVLLCSLHATQLVVCRLLR